MSKLHAKGETLDDFRENGLESPDEMDRGDHIPEEVPILLTVTEEKARGAWDLAGEEEAMATVAENS